MNFSLDRTAITLTLITFTAVLLGLRINNQAVTFTDEVLFEEASFRMARDGNWLIPQLDNNPWLEKPPLYFWLTAMTFKTANLYNPATLDLNASLNNQHIYAYPWIRKFWTVIAATILIASNYAIGKKLKNQDQGIASALILIATPLLLIVSTAGSLDVSSTACISLSILAYIKLKNHNSYQNAIIVGCAIAAGVMIRSFLALTPVLIISIDQIYNPSIKIKYLVTIFTTFIIGVLPWHLYVYLHYPDQFIHTYLGFNAIEHGLSIPEGYEAQPPYYYLGLQAHAPWLIFAIIYLIQIAKKSTTNSNSKFKKVLVIYSSITHSPEFPIILWMLIPFTMLTLAATRHPWYAIQFLPPIAILAAPILIQIKDLMYNRPSSPRRYLLEIILISFILSGPLLIMSSNFDKPASTVDAYLFASEIEKTDQPVYVLGVPYYPQTLLFNPHPSQVLNFDQLNSRAQEPRQFTLFVGTYYLERFNTIELNKNLIKNYDSGNLYLINPEKE